MLQAVISILILSLLYSCSDDDMVSAGETAGAVNYRSPIELSEGTRRFFEHRLYNSEGTTLLSVDTTVIVVKHEIIRVNNIDLSEKYNDNSEEFPYGPQVYKLNFFSYQWENSDNGTIISYAQPNDTAKTPGGVFIFGTYSGEDTTLLDTPKLWLPFPADIGTQGDTLTGSDFETVFDLNVPLVDHYGEIINTHLFKRGTAENPVYSYYRIGEGVVAILIYKNGKRVKSLKEIQPAHEYIRN